MGLNNIASNFWENNLNKAKNIINNLTVENMDKWWKTNMVQSSDELANVARASMLRKNTILSNLNMDDFEKAYNSAADKTNADFVKEFNNLKNNLNAGNIDEAKSVATSISERFQDGAYLKLLQEAENKTNVVKTRIDSMDAETIKRVSTGSIKEKIAKNKKLNNIITDEQQDKIADIAYKLQGKKQYFNKPNDPKTNQIRAGVAAGTYMGGSMVVRGLQGGNPVTNEYGERDIAGIPFI